MSEQQKEEQFIKGFNNGYLLSKHEPELLDKILESDNKESNYFQALAAGKKQHSKEKLINEMTQTQQKNINRGRKL